jgi:hypothetical protein
VAGGGLIAVTGLALLLILDVVLLDDGGSRGEGPSKPR